MPARRGHDRYLAVPRPAPRTMLMRAAVSLVSVVAFGTLGIMLVEGWTFAQSLFFTLITLTTVGYGDYGLTEAGKVFTTILLVGGLAVVTYSAGLLLPSLFNSHLAWERRMKSRILQLKDHAIVCGLGRIGQTVCRHLARDGVPFIAVDPDPDRVALVTDGGHLALIGDATDDAVRNVSMRMRRARS